MHRGKPSTRRPATPPHTCYTPRMPWRRLCLAIAAGIVLSGIVGLVIGIDVVVWPVTMPRCPECGEWI